jgi:glucokinase
MHARIASKRAARGPLTAGSFGTLVGVVAVGGTFDVLPEEPFGAVAVEPVELVLGLLDAPALELVASVEELAEEPPHAASAKLHASATTTAPGSLQRLFWLRCMGLLEPRGGMVVVCDDHAMATRGGIDLGGTKIQAAVLGDDHTALGAARRPTPTSGTPADVAAEMVQAMRDAAQDAGVEIASLSGVGVGSPGTIADGTVSSARNLPGWEGSFPLAETLQEALGCTVRIGNDVQVATDAEFTLGAGRDFRSLLGVFWGTGVGGGLILQGDAWTGRGAAGEIGHMVVKIGGAQCTCGRHGCMEAYAGRAAMEAHVGRLVEKGASTDLFKLMKERERTRLTSGIWARALAHEDKLAIEVVDRAIAALGAGVASAVNLLDVELVVIGGGLGVRLGEPYAERIAAAMLPHLFVDSHPPAVRVAALGDLGGAIGASLLLARDGATQTP